MIGAKETTAATKVLLTGRRVRQSLWGKFTKLPKHWTNVIQLMERLHLHGKNSYSGVNWNGTVHSGEIFFRKKWYLSMYYLFPDSENFRTTCQQLDFRLPAATFPGKKRCTWRWWIRVINLISDADCLWLWQIFRFVATVTGILATPKSTQAFFCSKIPGFDSNFLSFQMWMLQPEELKGHFHGILASFYNAEICSCINGTQK